MKDEQHQRNQRLRLVAQLSYHTVAIVGFCLPHVSYYRISCRNAVVGGFLFILHSSSFRGDLIGMASTISFACPKCKKQLTGPDGLEGKTIRCKECGNVFAVKALPNPPGSPATRDETAKEKQAISPKRPSA